MVLTSSKQTSYVADAYHSMKEFWEQMNLHESGMAEGTIWDTYECGERRQLEAKLAELYGSPDAVVVGSGMGAVTVALAAVAAQHQLKIEAGESCGYFENSDLLGNVFGKLGLIAKHGEKGIRLIEPITNEPSLRINLRVDDKEQLKPFTVIDNSLFSLSAPWETWLERYSERLLVIESLPKYLTHCVSGGVVYGEIEAIEAVRDTARRMGMLLPRHSCAMILQEGSLDTAADRIKQVGEAAELFAATLQTERPELVVRLPQEVASGAGLPGLSTSLVFVIYPDELDVLSEFELWAERASEIQGGRPMVRAGYGWDLTYGRAYGNNKLNTSSGHSYIRFSIGHEDPETIQQLARLLRRGVK